MTLSSSSSPRVASYRADIDGLRCVAVVAVLLFHLGFDFIEGGFIGVDVFFVISGFLVTGNILRAGDGFQWGDFLARRVRRLMPAVWATVVVTVLVSAWLLQADAAREVGRSALAAVFSVSNIFFWLQSGYWDTDAALKPLLHTWSLAVEEQFYLLWPLLLILARRWIGPQRTAALFIGLFLVGTVVSEWAVREVPSTAFFWMPFRIQEFAIGAALSALLGERRLMLTPARRELGVLAGLILIVGSAVVMNQARQAPGLWALPACLGTAMIIALAPTRSARWLLENPVSVYLGRISYSLYLVHWPLVSLYVYRSGVALGLAEQTVLGGVMLGGGALLHHLVEERFRYRRPARPILAYVLAAALVVMVPLGTLQWLIPWRVTEHDATGETALRITRAEALDERLVSPRACRPGCNDPQPGRFNVLVLGDSHGPDGFNALEQVYPGANLIPSWRASCMFMVGAREWYARNPGQIDAQTRQACIDAAERTFADVGRLQAMDLIVFSYQSTPAHPPLLDETLAYLRRVTDAPILVFGIAPTYTQPLPDIVHALALKRGDGVPSDRVVPGTWQADPATLEVTHRHGAGFVSRLDYFCKARRCRTFTVDGTRLTTYDRHHMSLAAAHEFGIARAETIRAEVARQVARPGPGDDQPGQTKAH